MRNDITIRDIARLAGVSVGTASMALNNSPKISEKTKERIKEIAEREGFRKNPFGQFLSTQKSHTVGCIVPDITNNYYGEMIGYLQKELGERGYGLLVGSAEESRAKEIKLLELFIERGVDGIISVPVSDPDSDISMIKKLYESKFPIVFISGYYKELPFNTVMADLCDGMYKLTKSFLERGIENILFIVGDANYIPSYERIRGFKKAYDEKGISFNPDNIIKADGLNFISGYSAIEPEYEKRKPEVVMTLNDIMAMGIISSLKAKGLRIPEDVSVTGFDDISIAAFQETPLTTVSQSMGLMCKKTVDLLIAKLSGEEDRGVEFIPCNLIIRKSTK